MNALLLLGVHCFIPIADWDTFPGPFEALAAFLPNVIPKEFSVFDLGFERGLDVGSLLLVFVAEDISTSPPPSALPTR